jgi:hypothetical protein
MNGLAGLNGNQGATWSDKIATDFATLGTGTPAAGDRFESLVVLNTHASQTLFVLLRAGGSTTTANAVPVAAGAAITIDCSGADAGSAPLTVSFQGSGAATTYSIIATLNRKF